MPSAYSNTAAVTLVSAGFSITAGDTGGGVGGYSDGTVTSPAGSVSGSLKGDTVNAFLISTTAHPHSTFLTLFATGLSAPPAQNLFSQIQFTDNTSTLQTFLSANAAYVSPDPGGNTSSWRWLYGSGGLNPLTIGQTYVVTVS